jgi:uroporphyrinogen decarboxylase
MQRIWGPALIGTLEQEEKPGCLWMRSLLIKYIMTSREKILSALNFQESGYVPLDLSGHRSSGISAIAYSNLRNYLHLAKKPIRVYDMVQQLAIVDEDVLDFFGVDTIEMGRGFLLEDQDWKPWVLPDGTACEIPFYVNTKKKGDDWFVYTDNGLELGVQKKGCLYYEQNYFPLSERDFSTDLFKDLEEQLGKQIWSAVPHPGAHLPLTDENLKVMAENARALRESTDRAIIGLFGGNMFEIPQMLFRMDNYLLYMAMYPEQTLRFSEKLYDVHLKNLEKWMSAVGPYIDIVLFGDDLGGQNGPLLSPEMYQTYYKPFHKKLWRRAKELAEVKVQLHCCGSVKMLIPDLIDAGLDAINPVQISCDNMDPKILKQEFGDKLTFWGGGCDTQSILPNVTPEEVKEHVREQIEIFKSGGGFVFQQVHNIMANVPPENIVAMFEVVKEFNEGIHTIHE